MNEKMMILKMLEEGKITASEASRLLEAAGTASPAGTQGSAPGSPAPYTERPAPVPPTSRSNRQTPPPSSAPSGSGAPVTGFEEFTIDLSKKFETFARDMEPKIYKITEAVAERTANVADKISKTISASASSLAGETRDTAGYAKKSFTNMEERVFESFVTPGYNELSLSGYNGDVLIKGYNGDKISARIYYKAKRSGARIEIMKLGNKYFLNYEDDDFEKVAIDAFVPETMFNNVNIQTINGQLSVSTLKADYCILTNANAATEIKGINAENLKVDCNNGLLRLENICGHSAKIENFNGSIQAMAIDYSNLEMNAQNGSITMNIASFDRYSNYVWAIETSNGKMTLNLPSARDLGYHVKAHTTLSSLKIGLTGLNYLFNEPSFIEAKSINYDMSANKVRLSMETSNAPLTVN